MSELKLDSKVLIVSETDKRGIVRYVNGDFVKISGFNEDEIIGKPHNIIRHPDMPKSAFKTLWETLKKDEIWKGFVKNSTKDGRYYWVFATVFPIRSVNGEGYLSVRTKANDFEIEKYENIYKNLKQNEGK